MCGQRDPQPRRTGERLSPGLQDVRVSLGLCEWPDCVNWLKYSGASPRPTSATSIPYSVVLLTHYHPFLALSYLMYCTPNIPFAILNLTCSVSIPGSESSQALGHPNVRLERKSKVQLSIFFFFLVPNLLWL